MIRIPHTEMHSEFTRILLAYGLGPKRADLCAQIFVENSLVGVTSHGVNRFGAFIEFIQKGWVKVNERAVLVERFGAWEQWDGNLGPGMLAAYDCTERAMELAKANGVGCVGLRNTNHWMRGGYYGWKAARAGYSLIAWTNTLPNMPPFGSSEHRLGNNPLVLAVPHEDEPVVLDMAMTQFSYGRLNTARLRQEKLPLAGGFDKDGRLTRDPGAILETRNVVQIGHWKGAGLSLLLDLVATLLSSGISTYEIGQRETEYGVSQAFIAFDVSRPGGADQVGNIVENVLTDLKTAPPSDEDQAVLHPGERALRTKEKTLAHGIPVDPTIWETIRNM